MMDLDALEKVLKTKVSALYRHRYDRENPMDDALFTVQMARLQALRERTKSHKDLLAKRLGVKTRKAKFLQHMQRAKAEIDRGAVLMSFDIERTMETQTIEEVGITTFHLGRKETLNLRVAGVERYGTFEFGETQSLPLCEIFAILQQLAATADHYIGHSLTFDFDVLKENGVVLPARFYYDTAWLGNWVNGSDGMPKLSEICRRYGVAANHPHLGGNDSRYTLDVFLAMVESVIVDLAA